MGECWRSARTRRVLALLVPLLVACGTKATLLFEVDSPVALLDQPIRIRILGARANDSVTVEASGSDETATTLAGPRGVPSQ